MKKPTSKLVKDALTQVASPTKAKASAWFFKTGKGQYGEGDQFIGVTVPEQRRVAKYFWDLPFTDLATLLTSPIHEHRLTALFILVAQYEKVARHQKKTAGSTLRVEPRELVGFYLAHRQHVNNWDLVDSSASQILGNWLVWHQKDSVILSDQPRLVVGLAVEVPPQRDPALAVRSGRLLTALARSKRLWDRRIAIIASGAFIQAGQFEETLKLAELLLSDKEDLIHKAVGWMLREVGKRDEAVLRNFLDTHAASMPRTMLRYAIEKLAPELREHYLGLKNQLFA